MNNCQNYQDWISAFIDGALPEGERLELMEHMALCPDCQQYFDDQIAIHDALTGLEAEAPAGFADQVMARVKETAQDKPEKKVVPFPVWRRWAVTAACCAIVALGVLGLGGDSREAGNIQMQSTVSYSASTALDNSSMDIVTAAEEPQMETDGVISYAAKSSSAELQTSAAPPAANASLDGDTDAVPESRIQGEKSPKHTQTLSTGSSVAQQWVEEQLGKTWCSGCGYELTAEEYTQLLALLDAANETYTVEPAEAETAWYLLLAQ